MPLCGSGEGDGIVSMLVYRDWWSWLCFPSRNLHGLSNLVPRKMSWEVKWTGVESTASVTTGVSIGLRQCDADTMSPVGVARGPLACCLTECT